MRVIKQMRNDTEMIKHIPGFRQHQQNLTKELSKMSKDVQKKARKCLNNGISKFKKPNNGGR